MSRDMISTLLGLTRRLLSIIRFKFSIEYQIFISSHITIFKFQKPGYPYPSTLERSGSSLLVVVSSSYPCLLHRRPLCNCFRQLLLLLLLLLFHSHDVSVMAVVARWCKQQQDQQQQQQEATAGIHTAGEQDQAPRWTYGFFIWWTLLPFVVQCKFHLLLLPSPSLPTMIHTRPNNVGSGPLFVSLGR